MNEQILKLHSEGWAADRIAAQLMVHSQDVKAIIDGADISLEKKNAPVAVDVKPKVSKISKKKDNGSI